MDEKDTLGKMFMDMGDANTWAKKVMGIDSMNMSQVYQEPKDEEQSTLEALEEWRKRWNKGRSNGFYNGKTGEYIDDASKNTDQNGWNNDKVKFKTIWEFTGHGPGKDFGQVIFNASLQQGVKSIKKAQSGSEIEYRAYPEAWLDMWFRDYDAKLSMEVYNKAKAKEALNQINNKNK